MINLRLKIWLVIFSGSHLSTAFFFFEHEQVTLNCNQVIVLCTWVVITLYITFMLETRFPLKIYTWIITKPGVEPFIIWKLKRHVYEEHLQRHVFTSSQKVQWIL